MDAERHLADCVAAIYEAATGGTEWADAGARLCQLLDAHSIFFGDSKEDGSFDNILPPHSEAGAVYASYFHRINPYVARARVDFDAGRAVHIGTASPGEALVAEDDFLRSEYYQDFARPFEYRFMIGGLLGVRKPTPLALYRGHGHHAFESAEVRMLEMVLPHFQRALELRDRLGLDRSTLPLSLPILDALPAAVGIVDGGLRLLFLNAAGRRLIDTPDAPVSTVRSGTDATGGVHLTIRSHRQTTELRRLVASAANGGAGGWMRVFEEDGATYALLISPALGVLLPDGREPGAHRGAALILLRPLRRLAPPPLATLCDVLGLSVAEAEVAASLFGGRSAEEVARRRGVSLPTIRNQIRSILSKAEADNLRDLERLLTDLTAIAPASPRNS
ncbi:helix-turn-helix transcriptional regulator [Bradyrhizobium sp.]|uniref:helix-turn-helix transcriptional regulator n=1 Tax=Bradyrhizobium sp. TaxID=376 RepID=UPI0039E5DA8A